MTRMLASILTILLLLPLAPVHAAEEGDQAADAEATDEPSLYEEVMQLGWIKGAAASGTIADRASIKLGQDLMFLDRHGTRRFLELTGNLPEENSFTLAPEDLAWFAIFSFDPVGYVKDDEEIDPDALFKVLKDNEGPANERRKEAGYEPLYLDGWFVPPHYDAQTKRLEWGTRIRSESGGLTVNYTSRLLGRGGVMEATLVSSPEDLDKDVVVFKEALKGFSFNPGERYAEFRPGDRVAEYGLAALVVGGAAAAAAKSGVGKSLIKMVVFAGIAVFAAAASFFKKFFGKAA